MLSIVIPTYNAAEKLVKLLRSIAASSFTDYEILVVDDGSADNPGGLTGQFPIRVVSTGGRVGPARARNLGARMAKGDLLLFLDSDVIVEPGGLGEVDRFFREYPDRSVMIGVYSPEPANSGILPKYKALQCFSYYEKMGEVTPISLLWAAKAAFRTNVFLEAGGFDETFDKPSMEDLELGRRISENHTIYLNRRFVVRHHFPSTFRRNAADHLHRGYLWSKIFFHYHRFDNYLHTPRRGIGRIAGFLAAVALVPASLIPGTWPVAALLFGTYLACNFDLWSVVIRRAPAFLPLAFGIDYLLGVVLGAAAAWAAVEEGAASIARLFRGRRALLVPADEEGTKSPTRGDIR